MCIDNNQCEDEMICVADNSTNKSTGFNRNSNNGPPPMKICLCDDAAGFTEDTQDNRCNGKDTPKFNGNILKKRDNIAQFN